MTPEAAEALAVELSERWAGRGATYEVVGAEPSQLALGQEEESATGGFYVRRVRESQA